MSLQTLLVEIKRLKYLVKDKCQCDICKIDDNKLQGIKQTVEADEKVHTTINAIITNLNGDLQATNKSKDFRLYRNNGDRISKEEHLDKLEFAINLFRGLNKDFKIRQQIKEELK